MQTRLQAVLTREQEDRRRFRRFRLAKPGRIDASITVVDISRSGCQIQHDGQARSGERIGLKLPGIGERMVDIIWSVGHNAGCEFHTVLAENELASLLGEQRPHGGFGKASG